MVDISAADNCPHASQRFEIYSKSTALSTIAVPHHTMEGVLGVNAKLWLHTEHAVDTSTNAIMETRICHR